MIMNELLHVPNIMKNLMSVSKFARDTNVYFMFYPNTCYVEHQETNQSLLQGTIKDVIYDFPTLNTSVLLY